MRRYVRGRVLDIGCGTKPYAEMLRPYATSHVGLDRLDPFNPDARADVVATPYDVPARTGIFDAVVSTATLEHLEEPEAALRECYRVLKPGGVALYSVPFIWHVHAEPWDYYRFTKYGLIHLFRKSGFQVVECLPLSGFWATFGQLFVYYLYRFHRPPIARLRLVPALGMAVQGAAYVLDRLDRATEWSWMYLVVARKGDPSE